VNALLAMAAGGGRAGNAAIDALIRMPGEAPGRILAGKAAGAEAPETCALLVRLLVARREASAAPALLAAARRHGDSALGAAVLAGYIRLLAFAPEEQGDTLTRLFEEAMALAHRDAERKLVLETAAARPGLWSLEFVEKHRTAPALKEAADAAYGRIFAEVKKMALLEDEVLLRAKDAKIHGGGAAYEGAANRDCIGVWQDTSTWVSWDIMVRRPGTFAVEVSQSMADVGGSTYVVEVAGSALEGTVRRNGDWAQFVTVAPGSVTIEKAGSYRVAFKPVRKQGTYIINLRGITLRREEK